MRVFVTAAIAPGCRLAPRAPLHVGRRIERGHATVGRLLDGHVSVEVMEAVEKAVEADFARIVRMGP